jgi:hypothetical protein
MKEPMRRWRTTSVIALAAILALSGLPGAGTTARAFQGTLSPAYLDQLMAPVALYPDQLLAQMLLCSENSTKVSEFSQWLKANASLKGSALQQAAEAAKFPPSFIALAPFSQVIELMAGNLTWTSQIGGAFAVDKNAVFASIQRLRKQSQDAGNLKSTAQQTVVNKGLETGEQVIVIEPANPQVVYVPQYNPQTVYTTTSSSTTVVTTAPTTTTVVVHEDDDDDDAAVAAGVIGFAAGIAIGASMDNHYYYGPYGYRGGAYMYGGGWDDWYDDREDAREDFYDNREDAREDWQDHREDMGENRSDRAQNAQEQRTERAENRGSTESQAQRQQQRTERQQSATPEQQAKRAEAKTQAQGRADQARAGGATTQATGARTQSAGTTSRSSGERSGTRSDAFSGYSSGSSTRAASSRGERSRSSSRGSRSGGGGRRR